MRGSAPWSSSLDQNRHMGGTTACVLHTVVTTHPVKHNQAQQTATRIHCMHSSGCLTEREKPGGVGKSTVL
jgi:hypothetical protein